VTSNLPFSLVRANGKSPGNLNCLISEDITICDILAIAPHIKTRLRSQFVTLKRFYPFCPKDVLGNFWVIMSSLACRRQGTSLLL
jgi:hypothetical protein